MTPTRLAGIGAFVIGGILLFVAFILFDTSMVTRTYYYSNDAISAATQLFYDFWALFRYVLLRRTA